MAGLFNNIFSAKAQTELSKELSQMIDQSDFLIRQVKSQMRSKGIYGNLTYRGQLDDCISLLNRDIEAIKKGKVSQDNIEALAKHRISLMTCATNLIDHFEEEFAIQTSLRNQYLKEKEGLENNPDELKVSKTDEEKENFIYNLDAGELAIWEMLYKAAKSVQNGREISKHVYAGQVAAAVLSKRGNIYTGVCIDTACSLGICAERNALFHMVSQGECEVSKVLTVMSDGRTGAPCGACREFIAQLMPDEYKDVEIMLDYEQKKVVTLGDIMKEWWI